VTLTFDRGRKLLIKKLVDAIILHGIVSYLALSIRQSGRI